MTEQCFASTTAAVVAFLDARIAEDWLAAAALSDRFRSQRLLAECRAKRTVLDVFTGFDPVDFELWSATPRHGFRWAYEEVLYVMATAYVDHADYRAEWADQLQDFLDR